MKTDLAKLDQHYSALPEEIKKREVMSFAHYPAHDDSFLITRLWDKHMSPEWRQRQTPSTKPDNETGKKIMEELKHFKKEGIQKQKIHQRTIILLGKSSLKKAF